METDRKEIYRYLGYGVHPVDEETRRLVEICMEELERAEAHKAVMREFPLTVTEDGFLDGGCFRTKSRNLLKNLDGCDRVLVMAATLGRSGPPFTPLWKAFRFQGRCDAGRGISHD